jgi:hypothetical protein
MDPKIIRFCGSNSLINAIVVINCDTPFAPQYHNMIYLHRGRKKSTQIAARAQRLWRIARKIRARYARGPCTVDESAALTWFPA